MQGIVIQGPTTYCKQTAPLYKDIPNTVWSMWEDEPQENIEFIKKYIPVILNKKPSFPGYLNINMQTISTTVGIRYLQEKGITEILKTRGDIIITDLNKFLEILKGKDIAFLAMCKEGIRSDLYYELIYPHYSHDYPIDLIMYGNTKNMLNAFEFQTEQHYSIPPEALIAYNLLVGLEIEFNLTYNHFINNGIYFFLNDCLQHNIELKWLKHNADLVKGHSDKNNYEY
jgi:hypothetical protein